MSKTLYAFDQSSLEYVPVQSKTFLHKSLIALLIFIGFIMVTSLKPNEPITYVTPENEIIILDGVPSFTNSRLKEALDDLNFKHKDIVYAQAVLETGNFTSTIFQENNNLFGMKEARIRITTNQGTRRGHAYYNSWYDSVLDYAMYQSRYLGKLSRRQYFEYLQKNYAEDPNYVSRLKQIISRNK